MNLLNAGQIRLLFDQWGNEMYLSQGEQIKATAEGYLIQKKKQFSGNGYLDQIEKNVIYLSEGTDNLNLTIAKYLVHGEPILNSREVPSFVEFIRIEYAQKTMPFHWNFVKNKCDGCFVHDEHKKYEDMRKLRLEGDRLKYLDELEFSYKYYQATYIVSQNYLGSFLQSHELAGVSRIIPIEEVFGIVNQRVRILTNSCIDNTKFYVGDTPAEEWLAQQVSEKPSGTGSSQRQKSNKFGWWKFWKK